MPSKKIIPNKPRFDRARLLVTRFIIKNNISSLPVDPFHIAKKIKIPIVPIRKYAEMMQVSISHVLKNIIKSNDGAVKKYNDLYFVLYNETISSQGRKNWTIMHEIAHVILGHLRDFEETRLSRGGLTENEYNVLEAEADYFTSLVLAPPIVLDSMGLYSVTKIMNVCKLSRDAASYRLSDLRKWKAKGTIYRDEYLIRTQFKSFIYKKQCEICGLGLTHRSAINCPICGNKLKWGEGNMIYDESGVIGLLCRNDPSQPRPYCFDLVLCY